MFRVPYNTRFAPSPTGDLHIGNLRTCYFNWLAARSTGGRFILRIDDTDAIRNDQNKLAAINGILTTLGLDYDIRFCQSERKYRYIQIAKALVNYRLADRAPNGAIVLDADRMQDLFHGEDAFSWKDWCLTTMQKPTQALWDQINGTKGSLILMRGDKDNGSPGDATFHFASVVDDWDYGINLIIRGTDHFTNTHKHVILWIALNALARRVEVKEALALKHAAVPDFSHVGLIMQDKKKMSKRDSAASVLKHLNDGVHPEALLNFMLRMGWGPKVDNKENSIIPKDKALSMFLTEGSMRSSSSSFDAKKLAWFDKKYRAMSATVSDEHSSAA